MLGPVVIVDDDGSMRPITSGRARTLLVALALAHPHAVSTDRLVESVWPDTPPQHPSGALHTALSRLRTLVGATAVLAVPGGYRLDDSVHSDLAAAERDARETSTPPAPARGPRTPSVDAAQALRRWRGEPGADLPAGRVRHELRRRADEAYRSLQERDWRARIVTDPAAVADEVARFRAERPLDEHLAAMQMRAAIAAGDPNTALGVHARIAAELADALGTDPGPELAAAHSAALAFTPLPHTPPPPADDFVGAADATAELATALASAPVVTVVGPGGIGKTRLVTEFIAAHSPPNVFIELSGARNAGDITAAVATALGHGTAATLSGVTLSGVTLSGVTDPSSSGATDSAGITIAALAPPDALVVLDTCEQLRAETVEIIDQLRSARDDLTVIATSRAVLGTPDEYVLTLAPLRTEHARTLVTRRARALRRDIGLDDDLLTELCERLDGAPLALELAAAQLRYLSLADVVAGLNSRFGLLSVSGDGRHHALADVVAASWAMLDSPARAAAEVLATFTGDVRLTDALFFPDVTMPALARLCDHSLATALDGPDGRTRYRLTETVREFIRIEVAADPTRTAALQAAALDWATDLLDTLSAQLVTGEIAAAVARLDESADAALAIAERAALRAADGDDHAIDAVTRLLPFVTWRQVRAGGYRHTETMARIASHASPTSDHRAGLFCATVFLTLLQQPTAAVRARAGLRRAAQAPVDESGVPPGALALGIGLLTAPPRLAPRILARSAHRADPLVVACAEIGRSDIAEYLGAPEFSRRCALRALVAAERLEHPWLIATARQRLGRGHMLCGDRSGAATHFARSADEFAAIGFTEEACGARVHQGRALAVDEPAIASELLHASVTEAGDTRRPYLATAHAALADLQLPLDPHGARRSAEAAIAVIGPPRDGHSAYLHAVHAVVLARTGAHPGAELAAAQLRVALPWLLRQPAANLPALATAAAAIAIVEGLPADHPIACAARGAHYRRDTTAIDLGSGPRAPRGALRRIRWQQH